jgi:hypothetical protein
LKSGGSAGQDCDARSGGENKPTVASGRHAPSRPRAFRRIAQRLARPSQRAGANHFW